MDYKWKINNCNFFFFCFFSSSVQDFIILLEECIFSPLGNTVHVVSIKLILPPTFFSTSWTVVSVIEPVVAVRPGMSHQYPPGQFPP